MKLFSIVLSAAMVFIPTLADRILSNPDDILRIDRRNVSVPLKIDDPDRKLNLRQANQLTIQGSIRRKLSSEVHLIKPGKNVVCSPVSALMPIAKLALGAQGASLNELKNAIGYMSDENFKQCFKKLLEDLTFLPEVTFNLASMVYVSNKIPLNEKYLSDIKYTFDAQIQQVDFTAPSKAAGKINGWVSRETSGKITEVFSPSQIDPATTVVLVNAVYFRGSWAIPFDSSSSETFFGQGGVKTSVKMLMSENEYKYGISEELQAKIIEIPYKGDAVSFVVVLPLERDGLSVILHKIRLAPELLESILNDLTCQKVSLYLPSFKIETTLDLVNLYKTGGITKIFDSEDSGLTGMQQDRNWKVNVGDAVQKALIEINDEGGMLPTSSSESHTKHDVKIPRFHANHPFYFMVVALSEQVFSGSFDNDELIKE